MYELELTPSGYFAVSNPPTPEELSKYYAEKYYQESKGAYQSSYEPQELEFINNKIAQKHFQLAQTRPELMQKGSFSLLDVGCGEGFVMKYFKTLGWEVTGLDYSEFGIAKQNPELSGSLIKGDIDNSLTNLAGSNIKYDVIWLTNVLEHLIDPAKLLEGLKNLCTPSTLLLILVPNDFSIVQSRLLEQKNISKPFWIATPDHLSYFNKNGLTTLCESTGWKQESICTDFPIDWALFNQDSNFVEDKSKGKNVHLARVEIENLMHSQSIEKTYSLYKALAELGMGRQICAVFSPTLT